MIGKKFSYKNKISHMWEKAVSIIMTEDELNSFTLGCDKLDDEFCKDLKARLRDYKPYDEEERKIFGDSLCKSIVVFEDEFPEFIEAFMEYIGIMGVEMQSNETYTDIIDKQQKLIDAQEEVMTKLKNSKELSGQLGDAATDTLVAYVNNLSKNTNIS